PCRTRHPPGLPRPGGATRFDVPDQRRRVQAVPSRRRVLADSRASGKRVMPPLADLSPGQSAEVLSVTGDPALVQRLYEMGLLEGERVDVVARALLGDPIEIRVGNSRLSLRKAEAANLTVQIISSTRG